MENGLSHYKLNAREIEPRIMMNKRIKLTINHHIHLHVKILNVEGTDVNRAYQVVLWLNPGEERFIDIAYDSPNPIWDKKEIFCLGQYPTNYEFLNLEVLRFASVNDPGTSSGIVIAGRARIPIPLPMEFNREMIGCFELVMVNHEEKRYKAKGHIILSIEFKRCII